MNESEIQEKLIKKIEQYKLNVEEKSVYLLIYKYVYLKEKMPYHKESDLRKKIIKYPNVFRLVFDDYIIDEDTHVVLDSILKNCVKYVDNTGSSKENWKYIYSSLMKNVFNAKNNHKSLAKSIANTKRVTSKMTINVIRNKLIDPSEKFPFLLNYRIEQAIPFSLSNKIVDAFLNEIVKYQNIIYVNINYYNIGKIIVLALEDEKITEFIGLNYCLNVLLNHYIGKPELRNKVENLIIQIAKSDHLDYLDNDVLDLALRSWKIIENDSVLKLQVKWHYQTEKRLLRLQESYVLMRDLFRKTLSNRRDVRSKLDSLLMG